MGEPKSEKKVFVIPCGWGLREKKTTTGYKLQTWEQDWGNWRSAGVFALVWYLDKTTNKKIEDNSV